MTPLLDGRICLVTGSGSGIGRQTVLAMLREGAAVVVAALMEDVRRRFGRLDALHSNAGVLESRFSETRRSSIFPQRHGTRSSLLRKSEHAAIVNCASVSGRTAIAGEATYGASKAAVIQLTRSLAVELAADGIRRNCYGPAAVDTPMTRTPETDAAGIESLTSRYLIHRLATPEDIGDLVCFFASDRSSFMTGAMVSISGGLLAWPGARGT